MFMRSTLRNLLSSSLLLVAMAMATPARSEVYIPTEGCNYYHDSLVGKVCNQWSSWETMARSNCTITPGEQRDQAFNNAFTHWGTWVHGMDTMLNPGLEWPVEDCIVNNGDGWSDYAVVPRSQISGDGLTLSFWQSGEYVEMDVLIANDLSFAFGDLDESRPTVSSSPGAAYDAIVHELGHAYGIGHSDDWGGPSLSKMKSAWPLALIGTSASSFPFEGSPFHWEAGVGRALYPDGIEVNVMTSAQKAPGGVVKPNRPTNPPTEEWYVGKECQCFTADFTIINRGTQSQNVTHRFFMNASPTAHLVGGPYTFNQGTVTVPAESRTVGFTSICPSQVPYGWYYLYHQVDYPNSINENNEADNVVRFIAHIAVLPC